MSSDLKRGGNTADTFSYAVKELQQHRASQATPTAKAKPHVQAGQFPVRRPRIKLMLEDAKPEKSGFDPYNTSGSFDRSKNWTRIGKR